MSADGTNQTENPVATSCTPLEQILMVVIAFFGIIIFCTWPRSTVSDPLAITAPSPSISAPYVPSSASYVPSSRESRIDAFVDREIQTQWRPIPGGNSREDAARVTKDILKARTFEELDEVIRFHSSQGR